MKIVCPQDELLAKLQIAARGVSQRSTVQILSGILIDAGEAGVELAATDMELSVRVPLPAARVEEAGRTACWWRSCACSRPTTSSSNRRPVEARCA
jgi:DNA polymerase III sliding clamp (beta) subunit (PCNA family)